MYSTERKEWKGRPVSAPPSTAPARKSRRCDEIERVERKQVPKREMGRGVGENVSGQCDSCPFQECVSNGGTAARRRSGRMQLVGLGKCGSDI